MVILTWRRVCCELGVLTRSVRSDFIPMVKSGQLLQVGRCWCRVCVGGAAGRCLLALPPAPQLLALLEGSALSRALWRASGQVQRAGASANLRGWWEQDASVGRGVWTWTCPAGLGEWPCCDTPAGGVWGTREGCGARPPRSQRL